MVSIPKFGPIFGQAVGILDILLDRSSKGNDSRFALNKFSARLGSNQIDGLYQPSRFCVKIYPGPNMSELVRNRTEDMTFLCSSAALPGVQIITSDHRRQNMGTFDRRPFGVQVTDIPLTFMIDQRGTMQTIFRQWTNDIVNYSYKNGEHGTDKNGKGLFEIGYKEEYSCEVEIFCLDVRQQTIIRYHLYEAFPMQVGDVTTAWAETDSFAVLPVQFTFRTFDIKVEAIGASDEIKEDATDTGVTEVQTVQPIKTGLATQTGGSASTGIGGRPIKLPDHQTGLG
jgi:hypothetical protein